MTIKKFIYIILLLAGYIISASAQSSYVIIVNADNDIESLSKKEISDIFLKKNIKWEDNSKIKPVDREKTAAIREKFSKEIHKKSVNAVAGYWQRKIFSGRGVPPVEKTSQKEMISYVKLNSAAIGYVSAGAKLPNEVKSVKIR